MRKVRKYEVFQKAHNLTLKVYKLTSGFPEDERYGLALQMRRSAYSIPMNIAEGGARDSEKEFAQFINIAIGSCEEIRYQLLLSKDLGYIEESTYKEMEKEYESIKRMLAGLYKSMRDRL